MHLLILFFTIQIFAQENCNDLELDEIVTDFTQKCEGTNGSNEIESSKYVCDCLKRKKEITKVKINHLWIERFNKNDELEKSFQDTLSRDFNDLISLFTKFNNYMLSKDHMGNLINGFKVPEDKMCNLNGAIEEIQKLASKTEISAFGLGCDISPRKFKTRVGTIFGMPGEDIKTLSGLGDIIKNSLETNSISNQGSPTRTCFNKQDYMNLRLSNGSSNLFFEKVKSSLNVKDLQRQINDSKNDTSGIFTDSEMYKDLITYNPVFSVAFRDPGFFIFFKAKIADYEKNGKNLYSLFQDREVNTRAYASINASCNRFVSNVKKFLCNDKVPSLHPETMQLHLDDYFKDKVSTTVEREALKDHFAYEYACVKAPLVENPQGKVFVHKGKEYIYPWKVDDWEKSLMDDYLSNATSIKNNTKDLIKENDNTDLADFNSSFCPQDGSISSPLDAQDLSYMMKSFIYTNNQKDLSSYIQGDDFAAKTGIRINLRVTPIEFEVADEKKLSEGKLPHISQEKWNLISGELAKRGLTTTQIKQLYTIVEMQTNRRFSEIEDLKYKLVQSNPETANLTYRQLHNIIYPPQQRPADVAIVSNESTPGSIVPLAPVSVEVESLVKNRYEAIRNDQALNLDYAQDLVFARRKPAEVQSEARVYEANNNTYDSNYSVRLNGGRTTAEPISWGTPAAEKQVAQREVANAPQRNPQAAVTSNADSEVVAPVARVLPQVSPVANAVRNSPQVIEPVRRNTPREEEDSRVTTAVRETIARNTDSSEIDRLNREAQSIKDEIAKYRRETPAVTREIDRAQRHNDFVAKNNSNINQASNITRSPASSASSFEPSKLGETSSSNSSETKDVSAKSQTNAEVAKRDKSAAVPEGTNAKINGKDLGSVSKGLGGIADGLISPSDQKNILSLEDARKKFNVKKYEYPKIIPHALVEVLGSMETMIIVIGLEGMKFQTIEVKTKDQKETFLLRDFDFIPTGEFASDKEFFKDPEQREILHEKYFVFPKTSGSIKISKRLAKYTKQVSSQEVSKSFILQIQNRILNEQQIRDEIMKFSEKVK